MRISEDGWLSARFGHPVYTVDPDTETTELTRHLGAQTRASYQAKVPSERVDRCRALTEAGLYVVDANVTLARTPEAPTDPGAGCTVTDALAKHRAPVLEIAATAFRFSRFHLDPAVPDETASRIKRDWIESYFRGHRGDELLVALVDGAPAGFLAVLATNNGASVRVIDLVATDRSRRSQGVGGALTRAFLARSVGRCELVQVGTQLANVGATRFYEGFGFTTARTQYVLHGHVGI